VTVRADGDREAERALVDDVLDDTLGVEECEEGARVLSVARRAHLDPEHLATSCREQRPDDELAVGVHLLPAAHFGEDFAEDLLAVRRTRDLLARIGAQHGEQGRVLGEHDVHRTAPGGEIVRECVGRPELGAAAEQGVESLELRLEHPVERARAPLGLLSVSHPVGD